MFVNSVVPRYSTIGLLLFLLFIDALSEAKNNIDSKSYNNDYNEIILSPIDTKQAVENIKKWFKTEKMIPNNKKVASLLSKVI